MAANLKDLGTAVAPLVKDNTLECVVREVAYERSERRGGGGGREKAIEDWVAAKSGLLERLTLLTREQVRRLRSAKDQNAKRQVVLQVQVISSPEPTGAQSPPLFNEVLPEEWIQVLAYRMFEARGWQHGGHLLDWYQAKCDLYEKFAPLSRLPQCNTLWNQLRTKPLDEALSSLKSILADMRAGKMPALLQSGHHSLTEDAQIMPQITFKPATPEQKRRAATSRDPLDLLTAEQLSQHRGRVIAVALNRGHGVAILDWAATRDELQNKMACNLQYVDIEWALCDVPSLVSRSA